MKRRLVLPVLFCTLAVVLLLPAVAFADVAADNAACLSCHGASAPAGMLKADFSVGPVDRSTACNKCHWISPHPPHYADRQCIDCHGFGTPARTVFYSARVSTAQGYFDTTASPQASAAQLHAIHSKRSWPADVTGRKPICSSCHAAAACDACHSDVVAHGSHQVTSAPMPDSALPRMTRTTKGLAPSDATSLLDHQTIGGSSCAASACHSGLATHDAVFCNNTRITYVGNWVYEPNPTIIGEGARVLHEPAGSMEVTFTGTEFTLTGIGSWNGGYGVLYVDGVLNRTINFYSPYQFDKIVCWVRDLAPGVHTLRLENAGYSVSMGYDIAFQLIDARTQATSFVATPACTNCHDTLEQHYGPTRHTTTWDMTSCIGSGCHDSADLSVEHEARRPGSGCTLCHGNTTDPRYAAAIAANDTSCGACHTVYQAGTHRSVHPVSPSLVSSTGPNYGYYTGSASSAPTTDCAGCHASNLVDEHMGATEGSIITRLTRYDSAGNALACDSCHSSTNLDVLGAIATKTSKCEACHTVHGPIAVVHQAAASDCSDCHSNSLELVHANTTVTLASGKTLAGCDVCHANYEGTRGAQVQYQIGVANSTACVGCHTSGYHANQAASHSAGDTVSIAGCADCHGTAGQAMDVTTVHAANAKPCLVCHNNPTRVGGISAKTAACGSCHATSGTGGDFHRALPAAHTYTGMGVSCTGAKCHAANTLPEVHEPYMSKYPAYKNSCVLCHENADPLRINWATASADCSTCHTVHGDVSTIHTATAPTRCFTCHKTADAFTIHKNRAEGECDVCHANPTKGDLTAGKLNTNCDGCHTAEGTDYHTAMSNKHIGFGTSGTCLGSGCHPSRDITDVHARYVGTGKQFSQYPDTCSLCHMNTDGTRINWTTIRGGECSQCHGAPHDRMKHTATSAQSSECTACHGTQVPAIHGADWYVGGTWAKCDTCHNNPTKGDLAWNKTTSDCEQCHAKYPAATNHYAAAKHTATDGTDCAGCHKMELAPEHIKASSGAVDCLGCHKSALYSATTKPWAGKCMDCHTAKHADQNTKHVSTTSACGGAGCHDLTDVSKIHTGPKSSCASCHKNDTTLPTTTTCTDCHAGHGDLTVAHTAPESQACVDCHESADVRNDHGASVAASCAYCHNATVTLPASAKCVLCHTTYASIETSHYPTASHAATAETGCNQCHYLDMKAEHFKTTVAVTCVVCHETKVDAFTAAWDKSCAACHPTKHGAQATKHVSTNSTCSGSGCHVITDVAALHGAATGPGCGACHKDAATPATTTNCSASGCHAGVGTNHHALHNGAAVNGDGCSGCHFDYLDDEHKALGLTCDTCHSSTNTTVLGAIAANDLKCLTCHPASAHNARQAYEFNPKSSSVHRVSSSLPGMQTSFTVNGAKYTWTLPAASSFLKSGWAVDSVMTCESCHTYTGSTGPHGSAMKVNIDPAYATAYSSGLLDKNSSTGMTSGIVCAKCHDLNGSGSTWSNIVHKEHDDRGMTEGGRCVSCHVKVPHGWKRPRLLGSTLDAAGYATVSGGNVEFALKSYTPNGWQKSDCYAACSSDRHPNQSNPWPLVEDPSAPTTGDVAGKVTDSASSAAVSGATVAIAGKTATTGTDGSYSFAEIAGGSYTMTVSKTGYTTWSQSVTVTNGSKVTQDVKLVLTPVNLALGRTFTASRYESSNYTPAKAGDGSDTSYWWSDNYGGSSNTEWLKVDLGSSKSISKAEVAWYGDYWASEFRVYTSTDNYNWTQVYSTTSGAKGTSTVTFTARNARYVRVECRRTGTGRSNGYGVAELRVFQ